MKSSYGFTLFCHHFHNTCLFFKGGKMYSEVERLLTRLIMGTNLPVVTLFNDMLLGSAPCWGCDSSPAGPAWWITVGGWWCNHSLAATDTCTSLTPVPSGCISQPAQPTGRHGCSTKRWTKVLYLPCNFPCRTLPSLLLSFLFQLHLQILSLLCMCFWLRSILLHGWLRKNKIKQPLNLEEKRKK